MRLWQCRATFQAAGSVHHREMEHDEPSEAVRLMMADVAEATGDDTPKLLRLTAKCLPVVEGADALEDVA